MVYINICFYPVKVLLLKININSFPDYKFIAVLFYGRLKLMNGAAPKS